VINDTDKFPVLPDPLLTTEQLAEYLGVSVDTVY
jgi:predicted DNA-binding transcriptional regulator AlpA